MPTAVLRVPNPGAILRYTMTDEHQEKTTNGTWLEDIDLVRKARGSDIDAFRSLFQKYQPIVFRNVLFRTRDTDLSHDIVQETFLRVWERRSSLRPNRSFLAYLLRISVNLVLDASRRERTRERLKGYIPEPAQSEGDDPDEALRLTMLEERLAKIIDRHLPERCRAVFLLSRIQGKSHGEIAGMLRISVRTVEHQIAHAIRVIRKELEKDEMGRGRERGRRRGNVSGLLFVFCLLLTAYSLP